MNRSRWIAMAITIASSLVGAQSVFTTTIQTVISLLFLGFFAILGAALAIGPIRQRLTHPIHRIAGIR